MAKSNPASDLVDSVLRTPKGVVLKLGDETVTLVRAAGRGGKIIFHDVTHGGVEWLGKRDAVKRVKELMDKGFV